MRSQKIDAKLSIVANYDVREPSKFLLNLTADKDISVYFITKFTYEILSKEGRIDSSIYSIKETRGINTSFYVPKGDYVFLIYNSNDAQCTVEWSLATKALRKELNIGSGYLGVGSSSISGSGLSNSIH